MTKTPFSFVLMISSVCAMCISGFIAAQNLVAQIDGMAGGWRESFWDLIRTDPAGIHLSFTFVAVFGAVFGVMSYAAVRYGILTRNHVIIVMVGIALYTVGLHYA